jgi:hypothetical protein
MARKRYSETVKPYFHNENIHVFYELEFGKDVIKPGDPLKFKNTRGQFRFIKWVHNSDRDVTWIDCMDIKDGQFRSFYIQMLKGVVRPKRSRRKKVVN